MAHLFNASHILQLSSTPDSFPFSSKYIAISNGMKPVTLGLASEALEKSETRSRAWSSSTTTSMMSLPSPTLSTFSATSNSSQRSTSAKRTALPSNGWFPLRPTDEQLSPEMEDDAFPGPIPVSGTHAEIWLQDGQVLIRDLDSAFGTFVNGVRANGHEAIGLQKGDIISLGAPIKRNSSTPAYIRDDQLQPVVMKVDLVGAPLRRSE